MYDLRSSMDNKIINLIHTYAKNVWVYCVNQGYIYLIKFKIAVLNWSYFTM